MRRVLMRRGANSQQCRVIRAAGAPGIAVAQEGIRLAVRRRAVRTRPAGWKRGVMRATWGKGRVATAVLMSAVVGGWAAWADGPHAQAVGRGAATAVLPGPMAMSADLRIQRRLVTRAGAPAGAAPPGVTMHLERRPRGGGWRTSFTLTNIDRPPVRSARGLSFLDHPFLVARMDVDDDGSAPRMYDAQGRAVAMPGARERQALGLASALRSRLFDEDALAGRVSVAPDPGGSREFAGFTADVGRRETASTARAALRPADRACSRARSLRV
jgi:hypothetical protein